MTRYVPIYDHELSQYTMLHPIVSYSHKMILTFIWTLGTFKWRRHPVWKIFSKFSTIMFVTKMIVESALIQKEL